VTNVLVIGGVVGAVVVAAAAVFAVFRARAEADERVAVAVRRLAEGMQQTMRDLADAYEQAQTATAPPAAELAASLDLDEVAKRTLEAAGALPGVDAAVLDTAGPDGERITAAVGLPEEEAQRAALPVPSHERLRSLEVVYRYREDVEDEAALVHAGVVVPLRAADHPLGTLGAFTRGAGQRLSDATVDELERIASRAGPALVNARRFAEARQLADLDALTRLHNRRYFHEVLGRECVRAKRYSRRLALIVFDLDDFKTINDRIGHLAGDAVLAEVADRVRQVVRSADIACRVGGDEFGVILPESGIDEANRLAERIRRCVAARAVTHAGIVAVSAGVAELREGDGAKELFERADDALYRAKELGKARTQTADGGA
jgi:diguanylate cyclase (GGDEF)-like protein